MTNSLTNNEIDMPTLQTPVGVQGQVSILYELPTMPLQCESREIEMPYKDIERQREHSIEYYWSHKPQKQAYDKQYRVKNKQEKTFKDKIYRILYADDIRINDIIDLERSDKKERKSEYNHEYRLSHLDQIKTKQKEWNAANRDHLTRYHRRYRNEHRQEHKESKARLRARTKKELYNLLNNKCIRCGETDILVLQLDHINGGGRKERKSFGGLLAMQRFYLKHPKLALEKLQLLCANCNIRKKFERNEI